MSNAASKEKGELRIVFAGTPQFASEQLLALIDGPHRVVAVYSQPDRKAGRGKKLLPSPVKILAIEHDLPVYQPMSLRNTDAQRELASLRPDLMVVVAYGLLLPQAVLDLPRLGCINVHASLLPRWRGAAPIERAIEAGDSETGITIMQMDAGLDTGTMLHQLSCPIDADTTGDSLRQRLSQLGPAALHGTLQRIASNQLQPVTQDDHLSNYAAKLNKAEAWLDWSQSATTLARKVRAFRSANVSCAQLAGERIKIWMAQHDDTATTQPPGTIIGSDKYAIHVACGEGILHITELQLPGRKVLPAGAVLNARHELFGSGRRFELPDTENHGA
jgi:methionyl-tRNA formyltransferase